MYQYGTVTFRKNVSFIPVNQAISNPFFQAFIRPKSYRRNEFNFNLKNYFQMSHSKFVNTIEISAIKTNFYSFPPGESYGFKQKEIPWIERSRNNLISRIGRKGVGAWVALKCRGIGREMSSYSNLAERDRSEWNCDCTTISTRKLVWVMFNTSI